jgi:hypothetical protein
MTLGNPATYDPQRCRISGRLLYHAIERDERNGIKAPCIINVGTRMVTFSTHRERAPDTSQMDRLNGTHEVVKREIPFRNQITYLHSLSLHWFNLEKINII